MNQPQILIVGLGGVGSWVLEFLARTEGISYIVGADLNEEWGRSLALAQSPSASNATPSQV